MKTLRFHADRSSVSVFVNGHPVALFGDVEIFVREPTKKSRMDRAGWALVTAENAVAVTTTEPVEGVYGRSKSD